MNEAEIFLNKHGADVAKLMEELNKDREQSDCSWDEEWSEWTFNDGSIVRIQNETVTIR